MLQDKQLNLAVILIIQDEAYIYKDYRYYLNKELHLDQRKVLKIIKIQLKELLNKSIIQALNLRSKLFKNEN